MATIIENVDAQDILLGLPNYILSDGDNFVGSLSPSDLHDVIGLSVVAGAVYELSIVGTLSGLPYTFSVIADGLASLGTSTDILQFGASNTGTYFVDVSHFALSGNYDLMFTQVSAPVVGPTFGDDDLTGTSGDDVIDLLSGDDKFTALEGNDIVSGGDGRDKMYGGDGDDTLFGGADRDHHWGGKGDDDVYGGDGDDYINGNTGDDELFGDAGDDKVFGSGGNDKLWGGSGDDLLKGGHGNDKLNGNTGHDDLYGGKGEDILNGGSGISVLYGGADADVFVISEATEVGDEIHIMDFEDGVDLISLSGLGLTTLSDLLPGTASIVVSGGELSGTIAGVTFSVLSHDGGAFTLSDDDFIF